MTQYNAHCTAVLLQPVILQIYDNFQRTNWSILELTQRAGLTTSPSQMSRKLRGEQVLRLHEAEALAEALGFELVMIRRRRVV